MGTSSIIARKIDTTNSYEALYCKYDGYPAGVGKKLLNYYSDDDILNKLFELGDLNSLGKVIGKKHDPYKPNRLFSFVKYKAFYERDWCVFFKRDISEHFISNLPHDKKCYTTKNDLIKDCYSIYLYLWENNNWRIMNTSHKKPRFRILTNKMCETQNY